MSAVAVTFASTLTVVETIDGALAPFASANDKTITHNGMNRAETFAGNTAVPVTKTANIELALSSGTGTIDLTAMTSTNGGAVSFSGLKVQFAKLRNKSGNANTITIAEGASNGYALLGAGFTMTLQPNQEVMLDLREQAPDVGGSAKTLDITGTGSQVLQLQLVAG